MIALNASFHSCDRERAIERKMRANQLELAVSVSMSMFTSCLFPPRKKIYVIIVKKE